MHKIMQTENQTTQTKDQDKLEREVLEPIVRAGLAADTQEAVLRLCQMGSNGNFDAIHIDNGVMSRPAEETRDNLAELLTGVEILTVTLGSHDGVDIARILNLKDPGPVKYDIGIYGRKGDKLVRFGVYFSDGCIYTDDEEMEGVDYD